MTNAILRKVTDGTHRYDALMFMCPGCAEDGSTGLQLLPVNCDASGKPVWTWDGSLETPTLSPSILTKTTDFACHSYLEGGVFRFLDDCTHSMAGKLVSMPSLPEWVTDLGEG